MSLTTAERRENFRRLVRAWRRNADLSTADLAAQLGVTAEAVTQWETRGSIPRKRATVQLAEQVLGAPPGTLTSLTHPEQDTTPPVSDATPTVHTLRDELAKLAERLERLEAGVSQLDEPKPTPPRPRKAGRSAAQSR